jgi:hypothetical protein
MCGLENPKPSAETRAAKPNSGGGKKGKVSLYSTICRKESDIVSLL